MRLNLTLPPEQQAELERRAQAAGMEPAKFVLTIVQERLGEPEEPPRRRMSQEEWQRLFEEWAKIQKPRNPNFDDSRESIYP
jgi:hypothetical protein